MTESPFSRPGARKILSVALTFVALLVFVAVAYAALAGPMRAGQILSISIPRLIILMALAALVAYCVVSLFRPRLLAINLVVTVNIALVLGGAELSLRLFAESLPLGIVEALPTSARDNLLARRGLFTRENLQGRRLLYAWRPETRLNSLPWVTVDRLGYRNPHSVPEAVDIVLLGDSVTIAQNSPIDLGDMFRKAGLTAINLGFNGYGPPHQRDAYRAHILSPQRPHKLVLVNFCFCNDVSDSQAYHDILSKGGDWRDYLGSSASRTPFPFAFEPPWFVSIIFHAPFEITQAVRNRLAGGSATITLDLPRGKLDIEKKLLTPSPIDMTGAWHLAENAIEEIVDLSQKAGAIPVLAFYPNLAQIYLPWLPKNIQAAVQQEYSSSIAHIRKIADRRNSVFFDYTSALQSAAGTESITWSDGDYHPNERGVQIMADVAMPFVKRILSTRP